MRKLYIFLLGIIFCVGSFAIQVKAETSEELVNKIKDLEKKVADAQSQAKTLAGQIALYDSQIQLTTLKVKQTEEQINTFNSKIGQLETKLQDRADLLEQQIVQTYKRGGFDELQMLFSSTTASELISRFKYLQTIQSDNRKTLHEMQVVQSNYADQKKLIEESRKRLTAQSTYLATIRSERDNLLKQTKSNETLYQKQLQVARSELEAIQNALASAVSEGPIKAGDAIGLVGNSGYPNCSTGKHLHFEVRQNDAWVNAENYLKPITDKRGLNIGSGSWNWPLNGSIQITQRYGHTDYSYVYSYSGGIHTGIDMVSSEDIIRAPKDGNLYFSTQKCGSSTIKLKYIDHGDGLKTFYLHIQ